MEEKKCRIFISNKNYDSLKWLVVKNNYYSYYYTDTIINHHIKIITFIYVCNILSFLLEKTERCGAIHIIEN